jgi:hypothetical protein
MDDGYERQMGRRFGQKIAEHEISEMIEYLEESETKRKKRQELES